MSDDNLKIDLYFKVLEITKEQAYAHNTPEETAKQVVALMETESAKSYLTGADRATLADRIGRLVDVEVKKTVLAWESSDEMVTIAELEHLEGQIIEKEFEAEVARRDITSLLKEFRRES
jgi:hypothetical protein